MYVVLAAKASGMAASHFKLPVWENDETVIFLQQISFSINFTNRFSNYDGADVWNVAAPIQTILSW